MNSARGESSLELRIPPPLVWLVAMGLTWGVDELLPGGRVRIPGRGYAAILMVIAGLCSAAAGLIQFRRAGTTINPHTPHRARMLVRSGIYRFTRNPMYLGLALLLLAWCVERANPWTLLVPLCFVTYLTRYQILPEERVLTERFGESYREFLQQTRRWL